MARKAKKGFFQRAVQGNNSVEEGSDLEELYEKLFPKIGRDFVYKEDLFRMFSFLMSIVDPLGINPIDFRSDAEARTKAAEYKSLLESGLDGSKIYKDLINLDD
jgi:hypothetical protein